MKFEIVFSFYILAKVVGNTGLRCRHYTPFEVRRSENHKVVIEKTYPRITTKTCKDHEICSRLEVTDTLNETYIALDCLDRSICTNADHWCNRLTGNLFTSCRIICCNGNLCAEVNRTKKVMTESSNSPITTCSIFTPFRVNITSRIVTQIYSKRERNVCKLGEICGGVVLTDRNKRTHKASSCIYSGHCKNPDMFCTELIKGTNGTFIDCQLKCCNESFCLEDKKADKKPKCIEYNSFIVAGNTVRASQSHSTRVKTCKANQHCSRTTFTDRKKNTHISLGCIANSVCNKPDILCQYFSANNSQTPFVGCTVECCGGDLCYSDSIQTTSLPSSSTQHNHTKGNQGTTTPRVTMPSVSRTKKLQTHIGTVGLTIIFYVCRTIVLQ